MTKSSTTTRKPPLIYLSDEQPGFTRRRRGKGFSYLDQQGQLIKDPEIRERIEALVIPPAWQNVWIAPHKKAYLQATGRDEKGRKQYIYHEKWVDYRQARKFDHIVRFAEMLPTIRKTTNQHLQDKQWTKRKVMALIVQILDETAIRIGNLAYKEQNDTYGLTTLRRKHLQLKKSGLTFSYQGKSGQYREVAITNRRLNRLIKACSELPGYEVFRYRDADGKMQRVDSQEVNEYLQVITQQEFSSKDFRTWLATASALECWPVLVEEFPEAEAEKLIPKLVKRVAAKLGNTVSVCRKYYIHPRILTVLENNQLPEMESFKSLYDKDLVDWLDAEELMALHLLKEKNYA
jgi:DNA topoisomerase-1